MFYIKCFCIFQIHFLTIKICYSLISCGSSETLGAPGGPWAPDQAPSLQYETGGGGFGFEHAHEVQVELGRVVVLEVGRGALPAIPVLLTGGDPILGFDVSQRVVVWTDVFRTTEDLPDDEALLRQGHEAVPEGHHPEDGGVDALNVQQLP